MRILIQRIVLAVVALLLLQSAFTQVIPVSQVQGYAASSPYNNQTVTVKGAVTGVYSAGYFIRDESAPWSGLYIYDPNNTSKPFLGDTVMVKGLITEYYEWTEMKNIEITEIVSSGNPAPEPLVIAGDELDESYESCLVTVENAACTSVSLGYGEWQINDGTAAVVVNDLGVSYTPVLGQKYSVTGPVSYSFGFYKLEPRTISDIFIADVIYIVGDILPDVIEQNRIEVSFTTNIPGSTEYYWGLTTDLEMGLVSDLALTSDHKITLSGLQPATFYYLLPYSVADGEITRSDTVIFITASGSSGKINVLFNSTPNHLYDGQEPQYTQSMVDSISAYIDRANTTIDMAVYDFSTYTASGDNRNIRIVRALNRAYDRGVRIRMITDADLTNEILDSLNTDIPVLKASHSGIMHNKFFIIDREDQSSAWLLTGSTNPTINNLVLDYNNFIAVQDQSLAKVYYAEFEEMWGGNDDQPNPASARFSNSKLDNTPHFIQVGSRLVESYFSPSDNVTSRLVKELSHAQNSVDFALMIFTEDALSNELIKLYNKGVAVKGVIDYTASSGSDFTKLVQAGLDVLAYDNYDGSEWPVGTTVHHKFAVIDNNSDMAAVITGSHNWTASANSINDENTLIIHDREISALFAEEAERIYAYMVFQATNELECHDDAVSSLLPIVDYDPLANYIDRNSYKVSIIDLPTQGNIVVNEDNTLFYELYQVAKSTQQLIEDSLVYRISALEYPLVFCDARLKITANGPIGIEATGSETFRIFPNPTKGQIFCNSGYQVDHLSVIDLTGKTLLRFEQPFADGKGQSVDVSALPDGLYIIKAEGENGASFYSKFILKK
ncbi:MAG: phospholipase D-like domain-containing protein [Bacteroidota bacterium]